MPESLANFRQQIGDGIERQRQRFSPESRARFKNYLIKGTIAGTMLSGAAKMIQTSRTDSPDADTRSAAWSLALSIPLIAAVAYAFKQRINRLTRDDEGITLSDAPSISSGPDLELAIMGRSIQLENSDLESLATIPERPGTMALQRSESNKSYKLSSRANRTPVRAKIFP